MTSFKESDANLSAIEETMTFDLENAPMASTGFISLDSFASSHKEWVALYKGDVTTEEAYAIVEKLIPEWWAQFKAKNNEYGTHDDDLGMKGQYADIHRKMKKLRNSLWDGKPLTHEQPREVVLDLIGHLFLTLAKGDRDGWEE